MERVAVKLDGENKAEQMIVGEATWAEDRLGGRWVQIVRDEPGKTYPSLGDVWDEETQDFIHVALVIT